MAKTVSYRLKAVYRSWRNRKFFYLEDPFIYNKTYFLGYDTLNDIMYICPWFQTLWIPCTIYMLVGSPGRRKENSQLLSSTCVNGRNSATAQNSPSPGSFHEKYQFHRYDPCFPIVGNRILQRGGYSLAWGKKKISEM